MEEEDLHLCVAWLADGLKQENHPSIPLSPLNRDHSCWLAAALHQASDMLYMYMHGKVLVPVVMSGVGIVQLCLALAGVVPFHGIACP